MIDMALTIIPKSDQLNADDLIAGPLTIVINKVSQADDPAQPINIGFDSDQGKPYKPCKSMRRVLVRAWGRDGAKYVGRSMVLYRDDTVVFGGQAVGGIRISHLSHIDAPITMALTLSKSKRVAFTVRPLVIEKPAESTFFVIRTNGSRVSFDTIGAWANWWDGPIKGATPEQLRSIWDVNAPIAAGFGAEHASIVGELTETIRRIIFAAENDARYGEEET